MVDERDIAMLESRITALEERINEMRDGLEAATDDCRKNIRQAHEASRDLRVQLQETKTIFLGLPAMIERVGEIMDTWLAGDVDEVLSKKVEESLQVLQKSLIPTINRAEARIYARFKQLLELATPGGGRIDIDGAVQMLLPEVDSVGYIPLTPKSRKRKRH